MRDRAREHYDELMKVIAEGIEELGKLPEGEDRDLAIQGLETLRKTVQDLEVMRQSFKRNKPREMGSWGDILRGPS